MNIVEAAISIESLLKPKKIEIEREDGSGNYYFKLLTEQDETIYIRRNVDGKVFRKINGNWMQAIGILIK